MLKKLMLVVALAIVLMAMPSAQDAKGVIAAASKAMGADSLKTIEYPGNGYDFALARPTTRARHGRGSSTRPTSA